MIRERLLGEMQFLLDHPYNESAKNYIMDIYKEMQKLVEEIERLKEELKEQNEIIEIGRKREYHSKFLKDFQKERGKNVFPDHDEIYKRYDDYKSRIDKAIDFLKENACIDEDVEYFCDDLRYDDCKKLLEILKGRR